MTRKKDSLAKIFICFSIISLISCSMGVPEKGYEYLTPPVILNCWQEGEYIIVQFSGHNDEYYFDGYNAYVSETSMKRTDIKSYKAVEIDGYGSTVPSFPLSPEDYDFDKIREITLYHYYWYVEDTGEYIPFPFSTGTYYIMLCSHHRISGVDEDGVSNQVSLDFVE